MNPCNLTLAAWGWQNHIIHSLLGQGCWPIYVQIFFSRVSYNVRAHFTNAPFTLDWLVTKLQVWWNHQWHADRAWMDMNEEKATKFKFVRNQPKIVVGFSNLLHKMFISLWPLTIVHWWVLWNLFFYFSFSLSWCIMWMSSHLHHIYSWLEACEVSRIVGYPPPIEPSSTYKSSAQ